MSMPRSNSLFEPFRSKAGLLPQFHDLSFLPPPTHYLSATADQPVADTSTSGGGHDVPVRFQTPSTSPLTNAVHLTENCLI